MAGWRGRFRVRGRWVEVRSAQEILATLDADGTIDGMPFMPEMLRLCGSRFRVAASAHKTCDTVNKTGIRAVPKAFHLENARCTGSDHGGCQAGCLLFWREEWLKPVDGPSPSAAGTADLDQTELEPLRRWTERPERYDPKKGVSYRCQATDLPAFTRPSHWALPGPYLKDLWTGNAELWRIVAAGLIGLFNMIQKRRRGIPYPSLHRDTWHTTTPKALLDLQPEERVKVKDKEAVLATLDIKRCNRGLTFDNEMVPYCGKPARVLRRVERLVNERTGYMDHIGSDCIILDKVTCKGLLSGRRRLCPRDIYPYWREIWLERVDPPALGNS